jgi:hypothetical protein
VDTLICVVINFVILCAELKIWALGLKICVQRTLVQLRGKCAYNLDCQVKDQEML